MSYEGRNQYICEQGHQYTCSESCGNVGDLCFCGAKPAWCNPVDDTNCYEEGIILDFASLQIEPAEVKRCDLGHEHVIRPARYRIPSPGRGGAAAARVGWPEARG